MTKNKLRKRIKDFFGFYIFATALFMLFWWPVIGKFLPALMITTITLVIALFILFCIYCILCVLSWIEAKERIEFILRSPIVIKRRQE